MAILDTYRPNTLASGARVSTFGAALVAMISDWNDRRSTRKTLTKLSDRELDDIGLTRGDIFTITN